MNLTVNGKALSIEGVGNVVELIERLGFDRRYIAIALNKCFLASELYATTVLEDGQEIEIVTPMQGG